MGGWMDYSRMRTRNLLLPRKPADDPDPYWRNGEVAPHHAILIGDLNRMERDYLTPVYPEAPWLTRPEHSSPAEQTAEATGVDVETVRTVLRHVFLGDVSLTAEQKFALNERRRFSKWVEEGLTAEEGHQ